MILSIIRVSPATGLTPVKTSQNRHGSSPTGDLVKEQSGLDPSTSDQQRAGAPDILADSKDAGVCGCHQDVGRRERESSKVPAPDDKG